MATLETLEHLAIWTGKDPAVVAADPFAQMVLDRATEMVIQKAGIPSTWETDPTLVPSRAKTICLLLAARTYTNRRSVISSGVGPISESILAAMAAAMQFTEAEAEELQDMANDNAGAFGGLWVLQTTRGDDYPIQDTVVLQDSSGSDWGLPYAVEGETGAFDTLMDDPGDGDGGGGVDPDAFALLQAQVSTLMGSVTGLDTNKADKTAVNAALALKANSSAVDSALANKADASDVNALEETLAEKADQADVDAALTLKADATALAAKANASDVTTALAGKADTSALTAGLAGKADATDLADLVTELASKADSGEVDAALALKAAQSAVDALTAIVDAKADASDVTTLEGAVSGKADQSTVDAALALKADLEDLGPQIHLGDTPPESGSGEVWADTSEE